MGEKDEKILALRPAVLRTAFYSAARMETLNFYFAWGWLMMYGFD